MLRTAQEEREFWGGGFITGSEEAISRRPLYFPIGLKGGLPPTLAGNTGWRVEAVWVRGQHMVFFYLDKVDWVRAQGPLPH